MNKLRLTIGEFSKLCFVTVKTLRHYEKMGLLIPHEVDEWTGYRYYDVGQMDEMVRIKRLKALGLSLDEIRGMLENGSSVPGPEIIGRIKKETEKELYELRQRLDLLQSFGNEPEKKKSRIMSKITVKPLPGGTVASWRKRLKSYEELGMYLMNEVLPEMNRLECVCPEETAYCFTLDYNCNHEPEDIDLEYCEIVSTHMDGPSEILSFRDLPVVETAVCIDHRGSYSGFDETMATAFHYIESHGYSICGHPRFCYIHGVWDCETVSDWLTEVQIPVRKA